MAAVACVEFTASAAAASNAWETDNDVGAARVDARGKARRDAPCAWYNATQTKTTAPCDVTATPGECGGIAEQVK